MVKFWELWWILLKELEYNYKRCIKWRVKLHNRYIISLQKFFSCNSYIQVKINLIWCKSCLLWKKNVLHHIYEFFCWKKLTKKITWKIMLHWTTFKSFFAIFFSFCTIKNNTFAANIKKPSKRKEVTHIRIYIHIHTRGLYMTQVQQSSCLIDQI